GLADERSQCRRIGPRLQLLDDGPALALDVADEAAGFLQIVHPRLPPARAELGGERFRLGAGCFETRPLRRCLVSAPLEVSPRRLEARDRPHEVLALPGEKSLGNLDRA